MQHHLKVILKKMCQDVGADFSKIDFNERNWYLQYEWTEEQENDFRKYFLAYLSMHITARKAIMKIVFRENCTNIELLDACADAFLLAFGWKIKQDNP